MNALTIAVIVTLVCQPHHAKKPISPHQTTFKERWYDGFPKHPRNFRVTRR